MGDDPREVAGSVTRSEWLREVSSDPVVAPEPAVAPEPEAPAVQAARAAQVARQWAGLPEQVPARDLGMVRWAGEGDTPDAGLTLSRPKVSESWLPAGGQPMPGLFTVGPAKPARSGPEVSGLGETEPRPPLALRPAEASDWLDRLYNHSAHSAADLPENDLGSMNRPQRRAGIPAHSAGDPGRFRNPLNRLPDDLTTDLGNRSIGGRTERPGRSSWPAGKTIVLPVAVLVGLAGLGLSQSGINVVSPAKGQVTLADPPLLTGQKGPSGTLVTVAPKAKATPKVSKTSEGSSGGGRHKAETPSPAATEAEQKAAEATAKAKPKPEQSARPTVTSTALDTPNSTWSGTSRSESTPSKTWDNEDRRPERERRGRHRKPDREGNWKCDPNYSMACVPVAADVDCLEGGGDGPVFLTEPARVTGRDVYRLDTNGDGWACEPW